MHFVRADLQAAFDPRLRFAIARICDLEIAFFAAADITGEMRFLPSKKLNL
jgi:hypothetical protein